MRAEQVVKRPALYLHGNGAQNYVQGRRPAQRDNGALQRALFPDPRQPVRIIIFSRIAEQFAATFRSAQACCSVVVLVGDAGMGMVQKRAGEIGVLAAVGGGGGSPGCGKRYGVTLPPAVEEVLVLISRATCLSVIGAPSFAEKQRAKRGLSGRASTGRCCVRSRSITGVSSSSIGRSSRGAPSFRRPKERSTICRGFSQMSGRSREQRNSSV